MNLEQLEEQILSHPLFQKLRTIVENYPGYHDQETTFDHLLKTARIAKEQVDGNFLTNPEAKEKFLTLLNQHLHGADRKTILTLTALLHDVGKLLLYEEGGQTNTLRLVDAHGFTPMPGHPYWGGKLVVPEILKEIDLLEEAKQMIADVVKVHDVFAQPYFDTKKDWPLIQIISDVKSAAMGYYFEALFNQYCDCYDAKPFAFGKSRIEAILNEPTFYDKRTYMLP